MSNILATAIAIAAQKHISQKDKGGNPYILHPLKVMYYLKSDDQELMAIAALHDVVEDTDTTYEELLSLGMTERVIAALKLLTKQPGQTAEEYITGIKTNIDAVLVKMADLRHNSDIRRLKGVTEKDIIRTQKYHKMYEDLKQHSLNFTKKQPKP